MDFERLSIFRGKSYGRFVSRGGRPASAIPYGGMPAYESETGALYVMENLTVFPGTASHPPMCLPMSYSMVVARTQGDGLTALHDDPAAVWSWRPVLYQLGYATTQALGSQHELEYRRGLWDVRLWKADYDDIDQRVVVEQVKTLKRRYGRIPRIRLEPGERGFRLPKNARKRMYREYVILVELFDERPETLPYMEANARADALLREHLSPQQLLDLDRRDSFFVRGEINRLYLVELGNGFDIVDPVSHEPLVSLCLHPEEWMPYADVALATKLSIDAGRDSEAEMLEAANPRLLGRAARPTAGERHAYRLEERYRLYP